LNKDYYKFVFNKATIRTETAMQVINLALVRCNPSYYYILYIVVQYFIKIFLNSYNL